MQLSLADFWKLAAASELLSLEECDALAAEFAALKGAPQQANVRRLAQWLVARGTLTKYQASVLSAGRPGPFVFGPFVIFERIENGRLARLYRATYEGSQPVLLVFLPQLTDDVRDHRQLLELAQACGAIKSPHVSRTYRATRQRGQSFVVTESLSGQTLEDMLRGSKPTLPAACQVGLQVAFGLIALHGENLTHGGICPRNIWIDAHGSAKILQFPLVQPVSRQPRLELPLLDYVAPEWTHPKAEPAPLVDIYSLGCVLYELLAGRVPFPGGSLQQKATRHRTEFPQRLDQLNPALPEDLADLVGEMLAKDPLLRCQSATEVAHLLAPFATVARGRMTPPKLDPTTLTPGYGAWTAPEWQAPPKQVAPVPRPVTPDKPMPVAPSKSPAAVSPAAPQPKSSEKPASPAAPKRPIEPAKPEPSEVAAAAAIVIKVADDDRPTITARDDEPELPLVVTDVAATISRRSASSSRSRTTYAILGGLGLALFAVLGGAWWFWGSDRGQQATTSKAKPAVPATEKAATQAAANTAADDASSPKTAKLQANLVDDDGETLWVSPTSGQPLDATYLPSGAQLILALRPAEILNSPEGPKLLAALGPAGEAAITQLRETLGVDLSAIEQLLIGFVPDENLLPQANYVVRLRAAMPRETLLAAWGKPTSHVHAKKDYYERNGRGFYLPKTADERVVAIGPVAMLKQMLELDGQPLLRSGIEQLLKHSDDQRQLTLIFTPSYLLTDGRGLLVGRLDQLHAALREFLDESIEAALLSAHVGDEFFVELRAVAIVDRKPQALKDLLRGRWDQIPDRVESHVAALHPQPHGQLVIHRFPRMLHLADDYTRAGIEDEQVVLSTYLPAAAAHNLLLGAELTLLESSGATQPAGTAAAPPSKPTSAAEALARKISLSFPREALDRAMAVLSEELGVPIVILGGDLQLEGITKNQSLNNVDERDQPASEVLRKVLKLANPDGKLVYQIKPDASGRETIAITTRAAVQKRGESLPPGF